MIGEFFERAVWLDTNIPPCYGRIRDRNRCCYSVVTLSLVDREVILGEPNAKFKGLEPIINWIPYGSAIARRFHFHAELNDKNGRIGIRIWHLEEYGEEESFELSFDEKIDVLRKLDILCKHLLGKTCFQLLKEARERMDPKELENIVI